MSPVSLYAAYSLRLLAERVYMPQMRTDNKGLEV